MAGRTDRVEHGNERGCGASLSRPSRRRLLTAAAGLAALSSTPSLAANVLDIMPFAGPAGPLEGGTVGGAAPRC